MSEQNLHDPSGSRRDETFDRDLEEALAYVARLKSARTNGEVQGENPPQPQSAAPAPKPEPAAKPSAAERERVRPAASPTPEVSDVSTKERFRPAASPAPEVSDVSTKERFRPAASPAPEVSDGSTKERFRPGREVILSDNGISDIKRIPEPLQNSVFPADISADPPVDLPEDEPAEPNRLLRILYRIIPVAGDPWWEVGRKLLFLVALVVLVGSCSVLLNEAVILPKENEALHNDIMNLIQQSREGELTEAEAAYDGYPDGISVDFKKLYYQNNDVRGRLVYSPCGVDNVVMWSADGSFYIDHDFYRNKNKHGSLFFDADNDLSSASAHYKSLVIYGHNMASGQMFAGLNELARSLNNMKRAGCSVQLETLFEKSQYKIFAVVLQDSKSQIEHYFSIQETSFPSDAAFMNYVSGLRARSLYDFNSVDVVASDDILIMYVCSPKSVAGFSDARLAVVARRVRPGESATVDSSTITTNTDVIMPYAWYIENNKTPHSFYSTGSLPNTQPVDEPSNIDQPGTEPNTPGSTPGTTPDTPGSTPETPGSTPEAPGTTPNTPGSTPNNPPTDPDDTEPGDIDLTEPGYTDPTDTEPGDPSDTDPTDTDPTDPTDTEPGDTDPTDDPSAPVDAPTDSQPEDSQPTEPEPSKPEPDEPQPDEPEPVDDSPSDEPQNNSDPI